MSKIKHYFLALALTIALIGSAPATADVKIGFLAGFTGPLKSWHRECTRVQNSRSSKLISWQCARLVSFDGNREKESERLPGWLKSGEIKRYK